MIKSMTAYGRGEAEGPSQKWVVELRSLNHRFLELSLNLPKRLWGLEDRSASSLRAASPGAGWRCSSPGRPPGKRP